MGFTDFLSGLPVVGSLFDDSQEKALAELKKNQGLYEGLELPEYQKYNPEAYQYGGDLNPEAAKYQGIQEDPGLRSSQMAALNKMAGLAEDGLTTEDAAAFDQARKNASHDAQAGAQAAMQNARARGVGGSGLEFAMREMANQGASENSQEAQLQQAAASARQRALYNQAYMQGLSGVRGEDMNANQANANIINQFNMANTNARNQAQQRNLDTRQQLSNADTENRNKAVQYNNQMQQQQYDDRYRKVQGQAGANTGMAQGDAAQNAANQSNRNANTDLAFKAIGYGNKKQKDGSVY